MTYVVCATWTAKPGHEEAVRRAIAAMIAPSRAEPGNRAYQPSCDVDDPRVFFIYEEYEDKAAYEAHGASDHFQRLAVQGAIPLLESRERRFLETFDSDT
jgi:quinol monooxygenase YgiN